MAIFCAVRLLCKSKNFNRTFKHYSQVYQPAVDLLQTWIDGKDLSRFSALQLPPNSRAYSYQESRQMFFCEVCNLHLKGRVTFEDHMKSRRHAKRKKKMYSYKQ